MTPKQFHAAAMLNRATCEAEKAEMQQSADSRANLRRQIIRETLYCDGRIK